LLSNSTKILLLNIYFLSLGIVVATNPVWFEISCYLDERMSGKAIHTFVHRGAHVVKEKLGLTPCKKGDEHFMYEKDTSYDDGKLRDKL